MAPFNLETAVGDAKATQDLESEPFSIGAEHSQKVKAAPIENGYGSRGCVALASPTAVSRFNVSFPHAGELQKIDRHMANSLSTMPK